MILIIRHGELENPRGIVYNRDAVMKSEDVIHLSDKGRAQFPPLAEEIKRQNKIPTILWSSPETRAQESAEIIQQELAIARVTIEPDLDDVYAPGPYLEGMTMEELEAMGGDVYDESRWQQYNHETSELVTARMIGVMNKMVAQLQDRQIGAMVSHGDPIAFLLNYLQDGEIPDPGKIRSMMYPPKGSATLLTYTDRGEFVKLEPFGDPSLRGGSNY